MPNGGVIDIFALVRARGMSACCRIKHAAYNPHKVPAANTASPLPSKCASQIGSESWAPALCKHKEMRTGRSALHETALRYETITSDAKKLGFDALHRGEIRRRWQILLLKDVQKQRYQHSESCSGGVDERSLFSAILKEEVEGCQAWANIAAASASASSISLDAATRRLPGFCCHGNEEAATQGTFTSEAGRQIADGEVDENISVLLGAVAVVSAILNHLSFLRWILAAATSDTREVVLTELVPLLSSKDVVSFSITEALIPDLLSAFFSEHLIQQCSTLRIAHHTRVPLFTASLLQVLGRCGISVSSSSFSAWFSALRALSEAQLLELKRSFRQELCERLKLISYADRCSAEKALHFKEACKSYRAELQGSQTTCVHFKRWKRGSFSTLNASVRRRGNVLDSCDPVDVTTQVDKMVKEKKYMAASKASVTVSGPVLSSSCWESSVLQIWKSRRETLLYALRTRYFAISDELKNGMLHQTVSVMEALDSKREFMSDSPNSLLAQLSAVLGPKRQEVAHLIHALWRWIVSACPAVDAEVYSILVLELVVFLFAAKVHRTTGDNMLSELMGLLKQMGEGCSHRGTPSFFLRMLEEPLATFFLDAVLLTSLHYAEPISFSASGSWKSDHHPLICVAEFLFKFHSPRLLQHTVSMLWEYSKFNFQKDEKGAAPLQLSVLPSYPQAAKVVFLTAVAKCSGCCAVECLVPPMEPLFLVEVVQQLGNSVLDLLRKIPVRGKRPLPLFLAEALCLTLLPLAGWALHHNQCIARECGVMEVRRLVELCYTIVRELAPRWDYSVVPARRRWKKQTKFLFTALVPQERRVVGKEMLEEEEYEADGIVANTVVNFASLLEGLLLAACEVQPHLLSDSCSFSCMCNAVGVVLHDVDGRTSHQIMSHLLWLVPPSERMDVEAHIAVLRCLASMRHGCTMWEEAVQHYWQAVVVAGDADSEASGLPHRRPHLPSDLATARVLRCVGSCPLPYGLRAMLTLRIVAFARASGVPLNITSLSACLQNFTLQKEKPMTGAFGGARWSDALGWYRDILSRSDSVALLLPPHGTCFLVACLQGLLAQDEWRKALMLLDLSGPHHHHNHEVAARETGADAVMWGLDIKPRILFLLHLCASDRTRSCAKGAWSLLQIHRSTASTLSGSRVVDEERLQRLYRSAAVISPSHCDLNTRSRTPLFRCEAPLIAKPAADREGEFALRMGVSELSYNHPRYSHAALVAKLETRSWQLQLYEATRQAANCRNMEQRLQQEQEQQEKPRSLMCIRSRVSCAFLVLKVLWLECALLEEGDNSRDKTKMILDTTRSVMDTHYASAMVSLRRLERLRSAKRVAVCQQRRQRQEAPDLVGGEGVVK